MLRHRNETLNEAQLREAQVAGGVGWPVPQEQTVTGAQPNRTPAAAACFIVGAVWLLLGTAFTLWGMWDYNHSEWRTATITSVSGDGCTYHWAEPPAPSDPGERDECPPDPVAGESVELFVNPDGMVWAAPDSMAAAIAVAAVVTLSGALALFGLGWFLRRPQRAPARFAMPNHDSTGPLSSSPPPKTRAAPSRIAGPPSMKPPPVAATAATSETAYARRRARISPQQLRWGKRVNRLHLALWGVILVLWLIGQGDWTIFLFVLQVPVAVLGWELLGRPTSFWTFFWD